MRLIRLSSRHREEIERHGIKEYPRECCGVLFGEIEADDRRIVQEVRPLPNTFQPDLEFERSVTPLNEGESLPGQERRYLVSPDTMFQLMQEERRSGRKILGFYHSHPDHPAQPSEYDRVWAMGWYSYIIVSIRQGEPAELNSWRLTEDGTGFDPESVLENAGNA